MKQTNIKETTLFTKQGIQCLLVRCYREEGVVKNEMWSVDPLGNLIEKLATHDLYATAMVDARTRLSELNKVERMIANR